MKINNATKLIIESKYLVQMVNLDGSWDEVIIDYLGNADEFRRAMDKKEAMNAKKHRVEHIHINSATHLLEVTAYEIA